MSDNSTPTPSTSPDAFGFEDAADQAMAREIASKDPLTDIKGPVTFIGDSSHLPAALPLTALSEDMRAPILAQLQGVPANLRAKKEAELVTEALKRNSLNLRVTGGGGEGTDPFWRETFEQERRHRDLSTQINALDLKLVDVAGFNTVYDPVTGVPSAKAVDKYQGQDRKLIEAELARLLGELHDLEGRGGQLRRKEAMKKAVDAQKAIQTQLEEEKLGKEQGEEMLRQERIAKRAESYANLRRSVSR